MKALSRLNLLNKDLNYNLSEKSILQVLFNTLTESNNVTLYIDVLHYDYLRGEVFLDDIQKIYHINMSDFSVEKLMNLLYADFMNQIRKGADLKNIAKWLMQLKSKFTIRDPELIQKQEYTFEISHSTHIASRTKIKRVPLSMKRNEAQRGEVLLYDLASLIENFDLTLEELISIRYQEFMKEIKAGNEKMLKAIASSIVNNNRKDTLRY